MAKKYKNIVHSRKVGEKWFNNQVGKVFCPDECVDCEHGGPDKILLESIPTQNFEGWLKTWWPKSGHSNNGGGDDESPF